MHGAPPAAWRPCTCPSGRRISVRFERGIRGEGDFYVPTMRVEVEDDGYVITARIPGAERDELSLTLDGAILRVRGERRRRSAGGDANTRYLSHFTREVRLTRQVDLERIEARFENGELTARLPLVQVPRVQEDAPTAIDIH